MDPKCVGQVLEAEVSMATKPSAHRPDRPSPEFNGKNRYNKVWMRVKPDCLVEGWGWGRRMLILSQHPPPPPLLEVTLLYLIIVYPLTYK